MSDCSLLADLVCNKNAMEKRGEKFGKKSNLNFHFEGLKRYTKKQKQFMHFLLQFSVKEKERSKSKSKIYTHPSTYSSSNQSAAEERLWKCYLIYFIY